MGLDEESMDEEELQSGLGRGLDSILAPSGPRDGSSAPGGRGLGALFGTGPQAEPQAVEPEAVEPPAAGPRLLEPRAERPRAAESRAVEPRVFESRAAEPRLPEPRVFESRVVQSGAPEPRPIESRPIESRAVEPRTPEPGLLEPRAEQPRAAEPRPAESRVFESRAAEPPASVPSPAERWPAPPPMPVATAVAVASPPARDGPARSDDEVTRQLGLVADSLRLDVAAFLRPGRSGPQLRVHRPVCPETSRAGQSQTTIESADPRAARRRPWCRRMRERDHTGRPAAGWWATRR